MMEARDAARRARRHLSRARDLEAGRIALERGWITASQWERAAASDDPMGVLPLRPDQVEELRRLAARLDVTALTGSAGGATPPEVRDAAADPARRLGRYVLVDTLGRGGMGEVWKAWDEEVGRWIAVKVLREDTSVAAAERFLQEARLAGRLSHPNLVPVFDAGRSGEKLFIAMALIEGPSGEEADLAIEGAARAVRDAARALDHAHKQGVVHRDVKPGNLLFGPDGRVHLTDFGLARQVDGPSGRTAPGAILGTPAYMSPEQAKGLRVTPASDIYGLAATLYRLVTGRPPISETRAGAALAKAASSQIRRPRSVRPDLPANLEAIILKGLEADPRLRYASASLMADDLDRFLAGGTVSAPRRRGRAFAVGGLALLVAVTVVAAVAASGRRPSPPAAPPRPAPVPLDAARMLLDRWERDQDTPDESVRSRIREDLRRAFAADGDSGPAHLEQARYLYLSGQYEAAREHFQRAREDATSRTSALFNLAYMRLWSVLSGMRLGMLAFTGKTLDITLPEQDERPGLDEARGLLAEFAASPGLARDDPRLGLLNGLLRIAEGRSVADYRAAAQELERLPDGGGVPRWMCRATLGTARFQAGDLEGARSAFREARYGPNTSPMIGAWIGMATWGCVLVRQAAGQAYADLIEEAINELRPAARAFPTNLRIRSDLASARFHRFYWRITHGQVETDDLHAAIQEYSELIERHPTLGDCYLMRGYALMFQAGIEPSRATRIYRQSIEDFQAAIRLKARPEAWVYLALARQRLASYEAVAGGNPEADLQAGVDEISRVIQANPGLASAWEARARLRQLQAWIQHRQGKPAGESDEASRLDAEKALSLEPKSPEALLARASALFWAGRFAEAMADYREAERLNPLLAAEARMGIKACEDRLK